MFQWADNYPIKRRDDFAALLCQSGLAHDNRIDGFRCRTVEHVKYGPYVNRYTGQRGYYDLEDQAPLKCRSDYFRFDDEKGCKYLEKNDKLTPWVYEMSNFQSIFYKSMFLLNGQSEPTNCQCNSDPLTDSYCIPIANYLWKDLH